MALKGSFQTPAKEPEKDPEEPDSHLELVETDSSSENRTESTFDQPVVHSKRE